VVGRQARVVVFVQFGPGLSGPESRYTTGGSQGTSGCREIGLEVGMWGSTEAVSRGESRDSDSVREFQSQQQVAMGSPATFAPAAAVKGREGRERSEAEAVRW